MKKKNRFIRWLPFVCATLLLLGSSMTVFAATVYHIPSDLDVENYDYVILRNDSNNYICYAIPKGYNFCACGTDNVKLYITNDEVLIWKTTDMENWGASSKSAVSGSTYKLVHNTSDSYNIVTSNVDIKEVNVWGEETGNIFFQRPPVPIAEMAIPLTATVQTQTKIIVPIAVCCLALLIGSIVLLPRLRLFLLR